ncbi:MAG: hypothetical protein QOE46_667 [Acidobacteriota bacterium]|jgi:hypothetical protein|nr:hypothetical protein [Acidobacteriota bacterium]
MSNRFQSPNAKAPARSAPKARSLERRPLTRAAGAAVRPQTPPHQPSDSQPVQLLKTHGAARFDTERADAPSGVIQANIIGGTQALQARLAALPSATQRKAAHGATTPNTGRAQTIQRQSSTGVDAFRVPLQPKSGGRTLPEDVRTKMETAFGADFSDVRIHVGHEASRIGAIAYTWGSSIHFAPGHYNPHTLQGQKVLGHELWHVVQQKAGRVKNPFGSGVAVVQDHALEAEADRMGLKAALTPVIMRKTDGDR